MAAPAAPLLPPVRSVGVSRGVWLALSASALLAVMAARFWPGGRAPEWPVCLLRAAAGIRCPGCGLGHALFSLLRGEWGAAWRYHPLVYAFAAQAALLWAWSARLAWSGRRVRLAQKSIDLWLIVNAALLAIVWVARTGWRG